jgi:hypothetical protein
MLALSDKNDPLTELLDDALVIVPDLLFEAATQDRSATS